MNKTIKAMAIMMVGCVAALSANEWDNFAGVGINIPTETTVPDTMFGIENFPTNETIFDFKDENYSVTLVITDMNVAERKYAGCTSLVAIQVASTVESIADEAFADCINLEKVTYLGDKSKIAIGNDLFKGCTKYNSN